MTSPQFTLPSDDHDPLLWLEEVEGDDALSWVRSRNENSTAVLHTERYREIEADTLAILDSDDRIPEVTQRGEFLYNFWRDAAHERGLWRRTTWESYRSGRPEWDVLIDLDALAEADGINWVWHGAHVLYPSYRRALVSLSRGGADATVDREFDLDTRSFVEDGFTRAESKGSMTWADGSGDEVFIFTDFGDGSMTQSGYPRVVKRWRRGEPLVDARTVYEGEPTDMYIGAFVDRTPGFERTFITKAITFYTDALYELRGDHLTFIPVPDSAEAMVWRDWLLIELRDDWTPGAETHPAGALLAVRYEEFLAGGREFAVLFTPSESASLSDVTATRTRLVLTLLDDVRNRLVSARPADSGWALDEVTVTGVGRFDTLSVRAVDPYDSDALWVNSSGFLTPTTMLLVEGDGTAETIAQLPAFFDADGMEVSQHFALSDDGTRVPYFQVTPPGLTGPAPTLLSGYGGFEVARLPAYTPAMARAWLARGGVYVLANIRGGGEYGPRWHQSALREKRHRAYEDFAAVARDLVARGVTTPAQLGTQGGSNGGLLMGNMLTGYPELFGAIVCQVPLLDMRRYSRLLAGASWMAEYGDPDLPDEWAFIRTFSPYHRVADGVDYPPVLFTTSTRDDRVHPGHARKMAALMEGLGADVTYFENIEGGHGGAATNAQAAMMQALAFEFLWQRVGER
ncbi:prolyl oligopeptidase family serine peptidase [Tessaracoccus flavus]|uniref:S9 family peptidase n=1 Tax=Tessaracoccus flavus TaxID=1610493 RepID=A0A1Q2CEF8_9ACTN|nr:prolyl oligopeptidase family serine peptidase [Tessaracoccus flavus]AQP44509.1 S9 family peptidase [Tessaracoccus flavus]SDY71658.1 prolyl oligopeptidase [Tessaracoccus flavus]